MLSVTVGGALADKVQRGVMFVVGELVADGVVNTPMSVNVFGAPGAADVVIVIEYVPLVGLNVQAGPTVINEGGLRGVKLGPSATMSAGSATGAIAPA